MNTRFLSSLFVLIGFCASSLFAQQTYWETTANFATDISGQRIDFKGMVVYGIQSGSASNQVIINTSKGIFVSPDNGKSWQTLHRGISNPNVSALLVEGTTMYAATSDGKVFRTTDNGSNWSQLGVLATSNPPVPTSLCCLLPAVQKFLPLIGTNGGVYGSADLGKTWSVYGLRSIPVNSMIGVPLTGVTGGASERILTATTVGISHSSDQEHKQWLDVVSVPPLANATNFGILLGGGGSTEALFTANPRGIYKSLDGGITWQAEAAPTESFSLNFTKITFSSRQGLLIANAGSRDLIYKKDFNKTGASWVNVSNGLPNGKIQTLGTNTSGGVFVAVGDVTGDGSGEIYRATSLLTSVNSLDKESLVEFLPHPVTSSSTLRFRIPMPGIVTIHINNVLGQTIFHDTQHYSSVGEYALPINLHGVPAGIYHYTFQAPTFIQKGAILKQ